MITIQTLNIWSDSAKEVVEFSVAREKETDEGGNVHEVIIARYRYPESEEDDIYRFSPNSTDAEILKQADEINKENQ
jgi:hypothetical protein